MHAMKKFKSNTSYLLITIFLFIFSNSIYSQTLSQKEFDQFLTQNNQKGVQHHRELAAELMSGNHERINKNICTTYLISLQQYQVASNNPHLNKALSSKENALANIKNLEDVIPKNKRPISTFCQNIKLDEF